MTRKKPIPQCPLCGRYPTAETCTYCAAKPGARRVRPAPDDDDIRLELSGGELVRMRDMYAKSAGEKRAMNPYQRPERPDYSHDR